MTCTKIDLGLVNGEPAFAIMCTRGQRRPRCATPGCSSEAGFECDYPLRGRKSGSTCSRRMCSSCRTNVGDELDYCSAHAGQQRLAL